MLRKIELKTNSLTSILTKRKQIYKNMNLKFLSSRLTRDKFGTIVRRTDRWFTTEKYVILKLLFKKLCYTSNTGQHFRPRDCLMLFAVQL